MRQSRLNLAYFMLTKSLRPPDCIQQVRPPSLEQLICSTVRWPIVLDKQKASASGGEICSSRRLVEVSKRQDNHSPPKVSRLPLIAVRFSCARAVSC
jgi:hypothetical protein